MPFSRTRRCSVILIICYIRCCGLQAVHLIQQPTTLVELLVFCICSLLLAVCKCSAAQENRGKKSWFVAWKLCLFVLLSDSCLLLKNSICRILDSRLLSLRNKEFSNSKDARLKALQDEKTGGGSRGCQATGRRESCCGIGGRCGV